MTMSTEEIAHKLLKYPELLNCVGRLLEVIENEDGRSTSADNAEELIIEGMREFGKELMVKWAKDESKRREVLILKSGVAVRKKTKKNSTGIPLMEQ